MIFHGQWWRWSSCCASNQRVRTISTSSHYFWPRRSECSVALVEGELVILANSPLLNPYCHRLTSVTFQSSQKWSVTFLPFQEPVSLSSGCSQNPDIYALTCGDHWRLTPSSKPCSQSVGSKTVFLIIFFVAYLRTLYNNDFQPNFNIILRAKYFLTSFCYRSWRDLQVMGSHGPRRSML
jgi:hypothetical protein